MKRNVLIHCVCAGCSAKLKIEFITEPIRTGAMWTVDCPVCGTSKMVTDEPLRMFHANNGEWIESTPHTNYSRTAK